MGMFGDLDIAGAEDVQSGIKPDSYAAVLVGVTFQEGSKNHPEKNFLVFEYMAPSWPFSLSEYKEVPKGNPSTWDTTIQDAKNRTEADRNKSAMSYIRQRLLSIGVPADRINSVNPEELADIPVVVKVKQAGDFSNIASVSMPKSSGTTIPTSGGTAPTITPVGANPFGN